MNASRLSAVCVAALWLCAVAIPSTAQADTDACSLLTPAQVGAAIGASVSNGKHVTPTYVRTCTWTTSGGSKVKFVTLYLQPASAYDGGKQMAMQMATMGHGTTLTPAGVGEDGYYFVMANQVGLLVKKNGISFKIAVYATLPVAAKETLEMTLAKEVAAKL